MINKYSLIMVFLILFNFSCSNLSSPSEDPTENPTEDPTENPTENPVTIVLSDLYAFGELKFFDFSQNSNWNGHANIFDSYLENRTITLWVYFGNDSNYYTKVVADREYKVVDFYDQYTFTESKSLACVVIGTESSNSWRSSSGSILISSDRKTATFQDVIFRLVSQEGVVDSSCIGVYSGNCNFVN